MNNTVKIKCPNSNTSKALSSDIIYKIKGMTFISLLFAFVLHYYVIVPLFTRIYNKLTYNRNLIFHVHLPPCYDSQTSYSNTLYLIFCFLK